MFVKGLAHGATPADIELNEPIGLEGYRSIARRLFEQADWSNNVGSECFGSLKATIEAREANLDVTIEGEADLAAYLLRTAMRARQQGVLMIDVGGFAILNA